MIIWKSLLFDEGLEFTHKTTVHMLNEGIFHDTLPCLPITFPKPCPPTPLHCFAFTKAIRVSRNFVHLPCQMLISPNIKMRDVSLFPVRKGRKETLRQSSDAASWYNLSGLYTVQWFSPWLQIRIRSDPYDFPIRIRPIYGNVYVFRFFYK